jgi:hypothetical protein
MQYKSKGQYHEFRNVAVDSGAVMRTVATFVLAFVATLLALVLLSLMG